MKMNLTKKGIAFLLVVTLIFSLTACGNQTENTQQSNNDTTTQTVETKTAENSTESEAVTLVDQLGREVTIKETPKTIVSAYYISTSLLIALNQQDKLVGVEAKADTRPIYELSAEEIVSLPNVGTAKEFDLEACASLAPDLVVIPAKLKDMIPSLEQLGLTVLAVNPENQELLEGTIQLLSSAVNEIEQGEKLLSFIEEKHNMITNLLEDTKKPSVYLAGNSAFLSTASSNMYQHSLIENAGGVNVASELTDPYWANISYEQLLAWNPDYIILTADAEYDVDSVLNDTNLSECNAVKNKQVYQLPSNIEAWDSPVPASILGSLWLASVLHPEQYSADEWKESVTEFYETFYRFTPTLD